MCVKILSGHLVQQYKISLIIKGCYHGNQLFIQILIVSQAPVQFCARHGKLPLGGGTHLQLSWIIQLYLLNKLRKWYISKYYR